MAPEKNAWSPGGSSITPRSVLETTSGPRPINPLQVKQRRAQIVCQQDTKRIQARLNQYALSIRNNEENQSGKKGDNRETNKP